MSIKLCKPEEKFAQDRSTSDGVSISHTSPWSQPFPEWIINRTVPRFHALIEERANETEKWQQTVQKKMALIKSTRGRVLSRNWGSIWWAPGSTSWSELPCSRFSVRRVGTKELVGSKKTWGGPLSQSSLADYFSRPPAIISLVPINWKLGIG